MTPQLFCFYAFATVIVGAALATITVRNPVHAVLCLVLAFFSSAATWLLIQAEFLGIALVVVYVGAVMVLFLFVVMMLDINLDRLREGFWAYLMPGVIVGGVMVAEMAVIVGTRFFGPRRLPAPPAPGGDFSNTKAIGRIVYTDYVYAFEVSAVLLLVAIIAAIAITMRRRKDSKYIDPSVQVAVRRADRIRLVSMQAEKE